MQRIALFEDSLADNFAPVSLLRPVHELICGQLSCLQRVRLAFPDADLGAIVRPLLTSVHHEQYPQLHVNDATWLASGPTLFLNSRWQTSLQALRGIASASAGWVDDELAWVLVDPEQLPEMGHEFATELRNIADQQDRVSASGVMLQYPWDLVHHNARQLELDFSERPKVETQAVEQSVAVLGNADQLVVHQTAQLDPFVVIDVRNGPVWIDAEVHIQAFTRIEGPAWIGRGTQTFRANIREGTSIGPVCRVGGEIEESILHGFVNKYHDGFLGHSYVCPWVNLGALSTNSDLKNDYSNVSVPLSGTSIKTNSNKVGCFIGDHTKTALCSLFNTGSSIGVGCLILPGGELLPKHIPSFSRIWHGLIEPLPDAAESTIATANIAMQRRQQILTPAATQLLRQLALQTRTERESALKRQASRAHR